MTNVIIKAITLGISLLTSAIISGCTVGNENIVTNVDSSITTTTTHNIEAVTTTTTTSEATTTTTTAKPETTTTTTTPATTTVATTPAPATTTTAATTTQAPVVTTTTTTVTTKPVETTAPAHNCDRDGHKWSVEYVTSEPKWCQENHMVYDFGFDLDLAARYFPNINDHYGVYLDTLSKMGVIGDSGMADVKVEVWGTETYEVKTCEVCGAINTDYGTLTITPIGEWQYVNGINPRMANGGFDFNTIHYDPYNIPQKVVDNISAWWKAFMGF